MDDRYTLAAARYVELNPVRAQPVSRADGGKQWLARAAGRLAGAAQRSGASSPGSNPWRRYERRTRASGGYSECWRFWTRAWRSGSTPASAPTGGPAATSLIRVQADDTFSTFARLTVANGFTNQGAIEITQAGGSNNGYDSRLGVSSGTLVNAAGASIASLVGVPDCRVGTYQSRAEAIAAPSTIARSFLKEMSGSSLP